MQEISTNFLNDTTFKTLFRLSDKGEMLFISHVYNDEIYTFLRYLANENLCLFYKYGDNFELYDNLKFVIALYNSKNLNKPEKIKIGDGLIQNNTNFILEYKILFNKETKEIKLVVVDIALTQDNNHSYINSQIKDY